MGCTRGGSWFVSLVLEWILRARIESWISRLNSVGRGDMKKGVGSFLLVLCLSVTVPGHAAGGWTLYDDFSSGIINPDKWFGTEGGKTVKRN